MSKTPPFIERQARRRQLERILVANRKRAAEAQEWTDRSLERLLAAINEVDYQRTRLQ